MIDLALNGDVTALRFCLDRLTGARKVKPVAVALPEIRSAKDLPAATLAILNPVAAGNLTRQKQTNSRESVLDRVRLVRHRLITQALADPSARGLLGTRHTVKLMARLLRLRPGDESPRANALWEQAYPILHPDTETSFEREIRLLAEFARELTALEQYERRALSRRKFAIRALDEHAARQIDEGLRFDGTV